VKWGWARAPAQMLIVRLSVTGGLLEPFSNLTRTVRRWRPVPTSRGSRWDAALQELRSTELIYSWDPEARPGSIGGCGQRRREAPDRNGT